MKRDRDGTDFRNNKHLYDHRDEHCVFCSINKSRVIEENNLAFLIMDKYPVTGLHSLVIPKRHTTDYFQINQAEINAINHLVHYAKNLTLKKDNSVKGFNIGLNCGKIAGQTIMHTHLHLIPRRTGDVEKPTGGVRNVIPGMGYY